MKGFLLTTLGIYLLLCVALFMMQRKVLYYPQASTIFGQLPEEIESVQFETADITLKGWLLNPNKDKALIYYGGNAESIEHNIPLFQQLNLDYSVYFIPYRGYGENTGEPAEQDLYSDAISIYDYIEPKYQSVSLMGRSLGTGIATYVAANKDVDNLILVTPYDSIENVAKNIYWMFPVSLLLKDKYRSWENIPNVKANTLVLIAEHDQVIPLERSNNLIAQFEKENIKSVIVKNATHNDISLYPEFVTELKSALR